MDSSPGEIFPYGIKRQWSGILFWGAVLLFLAAFLLIRFQSSGITERLFESGHFSLLNKITKIDVNQALPFYLGRMEEELWGPCGMAFAGVVFVLLAVRFLTKAGTAPFAGAVFFFLLCTRPEILFMPPYGDAVGGPFAEAVWLFRNGFDYWGLAHQPDYVHGGPKVYLLSIYPTYLALLFKLIPSIKYFLCINHLFVFAFSAVSIAFFRKILLKVCSRPVAALMASLFLAMPLVQSQAEAINMEVPVLMFSVLAAYFLTEKNVRMAAVFSIIAAMVKGYAVLICGAVFCVSVILFLFDEDLKFRFRPLCWGLVAIGFTLLKGMASFFVFSQQGQVDMVGPFQGWASLKTFAITYIFGASCLIFAGVLIKNIVSGGMRSGFRNFIRLHYVALVMFACAGAWFALFLNSYAVSPRYKLLLVPFFLFSVFYVLKLFLKSENFLRWGLAGAVIFSFFCSYGFLYPTLQGNNHVLLERSLEYRNDARVYIEVARRLEERFFEFTIGAPFIFAQALALPELGFVSQKFDVVIYEMRSTYGGIRNFEGLANMNIRKTVWIGQESGRPGYPIGPQDKILERIVIGNREADLFVGGSSIERMWRIVQQYSKKAVAGQ